jgi:hypothetical protein
MKIKLSELRKIIKKKEHSLKTERYIRKLVREELSRVKDKNPLTESQLHEIAPVIAAMARALPKILPAALPMLKKGGKEALKFAKENPEFLSQAVELVGAAKDKVPELKDVNLEDPEALAAAIDCPIAGKLISRILAQAAPELEKAAEAPEEEA